MKMLSATIRNRDGGPEWIETFVVPDEKDGREYCQNIINRFNETLRPGEKARELVDVKEAPTEMQGCHEWVKQNLVTVISRGQQYDVYKCNGCGATGKRFGLGAHIQLDKKYRAKKYETCPGKNGL